MLKLYCQFIANFEAIGMTQHLDSMSRLAFMSDVCKGITYFVDCICCKEHHTVSPCTNESLWKSGYEGVDLICCRVVYVESTFLSSNLIIPRGKQILGVLILNNDCARYM